MARIAAAVAVSVLVLGVVAPATAGAAAWTANHGEGVEVRFGETFTEASYAGARASVGVPAELEMDSSRVPLGATAFSSAPVGIGPLTALEASYSFPGGNLERTLSLLEGSSHADTRMRANAPGHLLTFATSAELTVAGPVRAAVGTSQGVSSIELTRGPSLSLAREGANAWVAVQSVDGIVAAVVVAGDFESLDVSVRDDGLVVTTKWGGVGEVAAAHYLLVTKSVSETEPFIAVDSLARIERDELGLAYLGDGVGAGVAWQSGARRIDVTARSTATDWWESLWGTTRLWTITVDADASQNGKLLRIIVPDSLSDELSPTASLDGRPTTYSSTTSSLDGSTDSFTIRIPHFSLRTVQIKTVTPGVPPIFMWLTLGLGAVVGGETFLLARHTLRSRAASRGMGGGGPAGGVGGQPGAPASGAARSEAVRRALGETLPPSAGAQEVQEAEFKSALLKKLQEGTTGPAKPGARARYARCNSCNKPIVFAAGSPTVVCPHCGGQNVNTET